MEPAAIKSRRFISVTAASPEGMMMMIGHYTDVQSDTIHGNSIPISHASFIQVAEKEIERKKKKPIIDFKLIVWKFSMMGTICPNMLHIQLKKKKRMKFNLN